MDVYSCHSSDKGIGLVIVVSEGLNDGFGKPIVEPVFATGRAIYFGDVSAHLAMLVTKNFGIKARSEKRGSCWSLLV